MNENQLNTLILTMKVMNSLSLCTSAFIVVTYLKFKRKFPSSMVLYFAIAAFFLALFILLGPIFALVVGREDELPEVLNDYKTFCKVQGFPF